MTSARLKIELTNPDSDDITVYLGSDDSRQANDLDWDAT
ncbi:hypothetical protein MGSAQ_002551, partial [marine sediment metagenome]